MEFKLRAGIEKETPKNIGDVFISGNTVCMLTQNLNDNSYNAICIGSINILTSYIGQTFKFSHAHDKGDGRFIVKILSPIVIEYIVKE